MREWKAASDEANGYLEALAVAKPDPNVWFTGQDTGDFAVYVRELRSLLSEAKASSAAGNCFGLQMEMNLLQPRFDRLKQIRSDIDNRITGFNNAVAEMKAKREALGNEAPDFIIDATNNIKSQAQPKIERINAKYDKMRRIVQEIAQEANGLPCATPTPMR
jgi:archaellum component FlaC